MGFLLRAGTDPPVISVLRIQNCPHSASEAKVKAALA